jgi:hypothetical protein
MKNYANMFLQLLLLFIYLFCVLCNSKYIFINSREKTKPITFNKVRGQLSEEEVKFLKQTPDYGAFSESSMKISSLSKMIYIKNKGCVTGFHGKFNGVNDQVKRAVEAIIQRG